MKNEKEQKQNARRMMRAEELAELLEIAKNSAYTALQKGEIPGAFKVGRSWRIDRETFMREAFGHESE